MKFIVIQSWVDSEGNVGTPVQNFDNEADAKSRYHGIMSSAYKSAYPIHGAILMNQEMFILEQEVVMKDVTPAPAPEPAQE